MADERYNFAQARARLEEIVAQVRKKDTSLEKSLDLLEEGVRLANTCTELSDHTEWRSVAEEQAAAEDGPHDAESDAADEADGASKTADEALAPQTAESSAPAEEARPAE
jgi:exodeoxyribonuclease VII small subunit